jgi:CPA2 family monovalent cation:H+ antiporter-2
MVADPVFFRDLAYVFLAAVVGGVLARLLHQPLVLGYVLGGILVGPFTPGPSVSPAGTFELFAEIGVVLLMFSLGIEFSLRDLLHVRWVALWAAPAGIVLTAGAAAAVGMALGWPLLQSLVVGIVISVGSSMVLVRLLLDRGDLHSRHGRILIGLSLVEDLAVVVLIVLVPSLGAWEAGRLLPLAAALGQAAAILVPFTYLVWKVTPRIMDRLVRLHSPELFLLVALALAVGTAALTQAAGLSLALGAFLAGLLISESDYAHETLARLLPLRDTFVAFFFVTLGALIDPGRVSGTLPMLGVMVGLIVVGKTAIRTALVWLAGQPLATALLAGAGLAQIGEFSFVLVGAARAAGHVGQDVYHATLATSIVTILVNAYLMKRLPRWLVIRPREPEPAWHASPDQPVVVLCGFGRVGSAVGEALETFKVRYAVVETDIDVLKALRRRRVPCVFGDAGQRRALEHARADGARLLVVSLPELQGALAAVRHLRALNPSAPILARAHGSEDADALRTAGATEVIQPELEAAGTLIRHAVERLAVPREEALAYLSRFRSAMGVTAEEGATAPAGLPDVVEIAVGPGDLADQSLGEARVRERFGVTVVAVSRPGGEELHNPGAETILREGDRVRVFGLAEQITAFRIAAQGREGDIPP